VFVCVTPNGDLDLTLRRTGLAEGWEVEVAPAAECAGGKGHNTARFLAALGHRVTALGFAGGWPGRRLERLLSEADVTPALTPIAAPTRYYVSILDERGVRERSLRQAGPAVTPAECAGLLEAVARHATTAEAVVLAGSLPPGVPEDFYARAIEACGATPVVVDAAGRALAAAVPARPWLVKVNEAEFRSLGEPAGGHIADAVEQAATRAGVASWWVTRGAAGAVASDQGVNLSGRVDGIVARNTNGAGDAFTAGLLHASSLGLALEDRMRWGLALSAAICEQEAPAAPGPERVEHLLSTAIVVRR
jgi:1-phosphofructokinase family hexose kinase